MLQLPLNIRTRFAYYLRTRGGPNTKQTAYFKSLRYY